ncbi:MAG: OB-fold nucleic acid binding domain-containing protein [Dokdonella sp.]
MSERIELRREFVPRVADYARVGLTLGKHPLAQIRDRLRAAKCTDSKTLRSRLHNSFARVAGLIALRQRPQTASGLTFLTMEDEHGLVNVIVWRDVADRQRRVLLEAKLLGVDGEWEMLDGVQHLVAARLLDMTSMFGELDVRSRDFHWRPHRSSTSRRHHSRR